MYSLTLIFCIRHRTQAFNLLVVLVSYLRAGSWNGLRVLCCRAGSFPGNDVSIGRSYVKHLVSVLGDDIFWACNCSCPPVLA